MTSGSRALAELGDEQRRLASLEATAQGEATLATRAAQAAEMVVARFGGTVEATALDLDADRDVPGRRGRPRARALRGGVAHLSRSCRSCPRRRCAPGRARTSALGARRRSACPARLGGRRDRWRSRSRHLDRGAARGSGQGAGRRRCGARLGARRRAAPSRGRGGRSSRPRRPGDRAGDRRRGRARPARRRGRGGTAEARRRPVASPTADADAADARPISPRATSLRCGSTASRRVARRWAASTRSPRRSTRPRRSDSTSSRPSGRISRTR